MSSKPFEHALSRFANCSPAVVDRCVIAVASEVTDLDDLIPGMSRRDVALIARGALEAIEMEDAVGSLLMEGELQASDWVLCLLAEGRFFLSQRLHQQGQSGRGRAMFDLANRVLEDVAASADRSPVLWYPEIFFEAAQALVRRGDREGIVRQIEQIAEELRAPSAGNLRGSLCFLAEFYVQLGEHRAGLSLFAAVARHRPRDPWLYNAAALGFNHLGLPSIARLSAERGLALVGRTGDPERLGAQLQEILDDLGSAADRSDAPADALADLRDALQTDFDAVPAEGADSAEAAADLARRLVPEVATARVKELPPAPGEDALASIAARLRASMKKPAKARAIALPAAAPPQAAASSTTPRVGRNDPCPCGSGKKYKKCCLK
jgi:hypothetical protein